MRSTILALLLLLTPIPSHADDASKAVVQSALPNAPPPPTINENDANEPQITIKHRGKDKFEEYRMNGNLYMIRVTPSAGPAYYLVDPHGDGQFVKKSIVKGAVVPPMWVLFQW